MKIEQHFSTDKVKEKDGVWIDVGEGGQLLIARAGNPGFNKMSREIFRPHRAAQLAGTLPDAQISALTAKVMAATVLLGWTGMEDKDGKPLAYTPETAERLLRENADFLEYVSTLANDVKNFRADEVKADAKNLPTGSAGN